MSGFKYGHSKHTETQAEAKFHCSIIRYNCVREDQS